MGGGDGLAAGDFPVVWVKTAQSTTPRRSPHARTTAPFRFKVAAVEEFVDDLGNDRAQGTGANGMSCTRFTMMLDGLARIHRLKLGDKKPTDKVK